MIIALSVFSASGVLLIILGSLYVLEDARGIRVMLPGFRASLDRGCAWLSTAVHHAGRSLVSAVTRFILRHGVYRLLGSIVNYLVALEQKVEHRLLHSHRGLHGQERQRNHLDEIADHKEASALSPEERVRRRE